MAIDRMWRSVLACWLVLSVAGCGLSTSDMVPVNPPANGRNTGASVTVMDVTGDRETNHFGGPIFVNNEEFKESLSQAIDKSGLFRRIPGRGGDYMLYARIKHQDQDVQHVLEYRGNITVEYVFRRAADEKVVWDETFTSEFSSTTFSGATRTIRAREGSVRENLASFLKAVAETWPH